MTPVSVEFERQREAARKAFRDELERIDIAEALVAEATDGYLTRREFAKAMKVSVRWIDQLLAEDRLPGVVRIGNRVRIPRRLLSDPARIRQR